jgi:inner membrane protein
MHPITHFLVSWTVADRFALARRDRWLVTLAGVLPDLDGLGLVAEVATSRSPDPLYWWSEYHHVLCHNVGFAVLTVGTVALLATRRALAASLALVTFHAHLLGDLVGSRGPDGYQWPIPYLLPFSRRWQLTWDGQWKLNAWPNVVLALLLLAFTLYSAWKRGYSPLEILGRRTDAAFVSALRARFGQPRT